jgi:hypothetical protein
MADTAHKQRESCVAQSDTVAIRSLTLSSPDTFDLQRNLLLSQDRHLNLLMVRSALRTAPCKLNIIAISFCARVVVPAPDAASAAAVPPREC